MKLFKKVVVKSFGYSNMFSSSSQQMPSAAFESRKLRDEALVSYHLAIADKRIYSCSIKNDEIKKIDYLIYTQSQSSNKCDRAFIVE